MVPVYNSCGDLFGDTIQLSVEGGRIEKHEKILLQKFYMVASSLAMAELEGAKARLNIYSDLRHRLFLCALILVILAVWTHRA